MKSLKSLKTVRAIAVAALATLSLHAMPAMAQGDASAPSAGSAAGAKADAKAQRTANRILQKKIRAALAKTKDLDVTNISVRARSGAVVLEGTVPEQAQIDRAGEVAKGVDGVTSVKNALALRPKGA
jgi:hyperosmotically inducible periplasmic protein